MIKAKEGMRVVVVFPNEWPKKIRHGTITKVGELVCEETGEILTEHYPQEIKLDDKTTTEGLKCWWLPFSEEHNENNKN